MKLFRFRYSPYARKVQAVLDWLGQPYELIEVPYSDRRELATLTGGYIYVPVLLTETGQVLRESRDICQHLVSGSPGKALVPAALEGPIWAYHDFIDNQLEDVLFRIASPLIRDSWANPGDRALYALIKERKFGAGCVDAWQLDRANLVKRAQQLLAATLRTLEHAPFLFGQTPSVADAALYGQCLMLHEASPELLKEVAPALVSYAERCARVRL